MKRFSFAWLLAFLYLSSCGVSPETRILNEIGTYIQERPDSALKVLSQIDTASLNSPKERAQYSLLHAIALDKNYIDTTDLRVIRPAIEYYEKHGSHRDKMLAYYYQGRILFNSRRDAEAIISQTHALEHAQRIDAGRYLGMIYAAMSDLSSRSYCWDESAHFISNAKECFRSISDTLAFYLATEKEVINLANQDKQMEALMLTDSLMRHNLIPEPLLNDFLLLKAGMMVDTAIVDYRSALPYYFEALRRGAHPTVKQNAKYAFALAKCGYQNEAERIFEAIGNKNKTNSAIVASKRQELLFREGRYEEAYRLLRGSLDYQEETVNRLLNQSLFRTQRDYFISKENETLLRNQNQRAAIILLTLSVILTATILGTLIKRARQKAKYKEIEVERLSESMSQLLRAKTQSLTELESKFLQIHKEQFKLLEHYYKDFEMARRSGANDKELYSRLLAIIKDIEGNTDRQRYLDALIDEQFDGIMARLRQECPKLPKQDYLLFSYTAAGFEKSTIGMLFGNLSADAIHMRRSRLRKNLRSFNPPSLQEFLKVLEMR